ncbi:hypothetical protein BU23DRAFT_550166 [Bimuria novae-zelandiae CBS 107.79]|uniref:Uncharacterized protein n=1 Tax=Bimuria novae-zelandiae CBS 107.79 TaxID=1447943 RepID=A0A6A5VK55_9PLEO|nr:hypothetical protein BU23DRAFT_550166 [Bimuria novae-zelandiae CBS 107.79]
MVALPTVRRWILTGSVTAITVTGALYGADLKTSQERAQERKRITALSANEKISQYEAVIEEWERTRKELERKLENFHARKEGREVGEGDRRMSR